MTINRPWSAGFGRLIAMLVLLVVIIAWGTTVSVPHLDRWLIAGLALALMIG